MSRGRAVVVIGVVVLAAVVAVLALSRGGDAPPDAARDTTAGGPVHGTPLPSARSARLRFDHGGLRLEGQVVDEQLRPVAGAHVVLDGVPERVVISEADGSFAFDQLAPGRYTLTAASDELYAGRVRARLTEHSEPVILHLRAGATAIIRVVEADGGAPISGAAVVRDHRRFVTGRDGVARVRGLRPEGDELAITADGHAPASLLLSPGDDAQNVVHRTVALHRGAPVSGTVVDPDGRPVADAEVEIASILPAWHGTARSDGAGAWHVDALAAGKHVLRASSETFGPAPDLLINVDGEHPMTGVVIHVARDGQLVGTVVDAAGAPVAGAEIACEREMERLATGTSDASGHFELLGVRVGAFDVSARAGNRASPTTHVALTADRRVEIRLVVEDASIAGIVVDGRGDPVAEASVHAFPVVFGPASQTDVTNARGEFDLGGVVPGAWRLSASRPGQRELDLQGVIAHAGDRAVKLVLADASAITGRVMLDGAPVPYFGVIITSSPSLSWQRSPVSVRAADGRFTRPEVAVGTWSVVIAGPGFARKVVSDVTVSAGKVTDLGDIAVDHGRHVAGHVVDGSGAGVAGATVAIDYSNHYLTEDDPLRALEQGVQTATSDASGAYAFYGVNAPVESYDKLQIGATHPTLGTAPTRSVPAGDSPVDLVLIATGGIDGILLGDHADYRLVNVSKATEHGFRTVEVDAAGEFSVDGLEPGDYRVRVLTGPGGGPAAVPATVVANQRATVTITCGGGVTAVVHYTGTCDTVDMYGDERIGFSSCKAGTVTYDDLPPATYRTCGGAPPCVEIKVLPAPPIQEFTIPAGSAAR